VFATLVVMIFCVCKRYQLNRYPTCANTVRRYSPLMLAASVHTADERDHRQVTSVAYAAHSGHSVQRADRLLLAGYCLTRSAAADPLSARLSQTSCIHVMPHCVPGSLAEGTPLCCSRECDANAGHVILLLQVARHTSVT
jgi:hypothetical protein